MPKTLEYFCYGVWRKYRVHLSIFTWYGGHVSFCSETLFHVWPVNLSVIDLLVGITPLYFNSQRSTIETARQA